MLKQDLTLQNFELDKLFSFRQSKGKNENVIGLMKDELGGQIMK